MEFRLRSYRLSFGKEYHIDDVPPRIYNAEGRLLETYFIRNRHSQHAPYGHEGKYFFWDRYNYGLDTHFYGPEVMVLGMGQPKVKYGMLTESRTIVPKDYEVFHKHRGLEREFRYIFNYDERILQELENARFYPVAAGIWNSSPKEGLYERKEENVSILCSDKVLCPLHQFRLELARACKREALAHTFGRFDGGTYIESVDECLDRFRFSIVIENDISDYYFSERLTSCFAADTIPVYLGARKISEFFNPEGILFLPDMDIEHAKAVLAQCTKGTYEERIEAVKDNHRRVQEYVNMQDYLYEHYLMK